MRKNLKILLCSPSKPFGHAFGDSFSCQTNGSHQLTWAQDIFRVEDQMFHWGLDLIAANLNAPVTVLHYPTLHEFRSELKKGYDYIGLSFNLSTLHKIKKMVQSIREFSPGSKIILGGYGTVLSDSVLSGLADYICREEGVTFMRRLLQEKEKAFVNPHFVIERNIFSLKVSLIGVIFNAVGCPNGCEFCCTSHFYKRRKVYFNSTAQELLEKILSLRRKNPYIESAIIFDDDFLVDETRARNFHSEVTACKETIDIMIFASIRSISRFSAGEIAQMGVTKIWIGYEGQKCGYEKQQGKPFKQVVDELREYGIAVTASIMIGFDYQDEHIIREELQDLISCGPSSTQIILVTPCVGTPLWDKLNKCSRIRAKVKEDYRFHDGFNLLFDHPKIESGRIEQLQKDLYRHEYRRLGPSIFRVIYTCYLGYKNLKDDADHSMRKRALYFKNKVKKALALYKLGIMFAPGKEVKRRLQKEYEIICQDLGRPYLAEYATLILLPLVYLTKLRFRFNIGSQPRSLKRKYNFN